MESLSIRHPEWLQVLKDGRHSFGYNQEWYHDEWQRVSGCGPTTATQVISYVEFRDGYLNTADSSDGEAALKRMETLWHYVRPRIGGGLYKTHWLEDGLTDYIKEQNMPYEVKMISIYPFSMCRPSLQQVKEFIRRGLSEDSPVAAKLLGGLGMEPLSEEFLLPTFQAGLKKSRMPIKQLLLAGRLVVGVGNIYASEVLFLSGIRPTTAASRIGAARVHKLHQAIRSVLARAVEMGGSTLRDFSNADGMAGHFQTAANVYGRDGQPCHACGTAIELIRQGQRSTYFCRQCQRP